MTEDLGERFWSKVQRQPESDCWLWTAAKNTFGYGQFRIQGCTRLAHRLAYQALVGPIGKGLTLDHLCRNRACVNPTHLEPVTHRENVLRGESPAALHALKTHCRVGHLFDDANTYMNTAGSRVCKSCRRARRNARYRAGKAAA